MNMSDQEELNAEVALHQHPCHNVESDTPDSKRKLNKLKILTHTKKTLINAVHKLWNTDLKSTREWNDTTQELIMAILKF
jgi:hypothetical protein